MSIFPKIRPFSSVQEHCPLVAVTPDGLTFSKGGQCSRVIELHGRDYSGLEDKHVESLFQGRKAFFERMPENITVLYQAHRHKLYRELAEERYSLPMAQDVARKWVKNFATTYRTRHFLVFVTGSDFFDQAMIFGGKSSNDESLQSEQRRELDEITADALVRLQGYGPVELTGDDLTSYWAWLLNGRPVFQKAPPNGLLDDMLSGTELYFSTDKRFQTYDSTNGKKYSAWLIVKEPPPSTSSGLLNHLFQLKHNISLFQTFSLIRKSEALAYIEDKRKNVLAFGQGVGIIMSELQELENRISAEELDLARHRWAMEVFADTEKDLARAVHEVGNAVERFGYRVAREGVNCEALFWSRFPGTQDFNVRQRKITTENASHLATFASVGEGLSHCTWGGPVTQFKTEADTEFSFTFHESPDQDAPGNALIIGGMGSGKTSLIAFLLSQCFKYPNFRALCFDRNHGLECFTRTHGGSYLSFDAEIDLMPLQLDDSIENRTFLNVWLEILTGKNSDTDREEIGEGVAQLFKLPKEQRSLTHIADAFGQPSPKSVRRALQRWLPDGAKGNYFNGQRDSLDFTSPLVGVDMTTILDDAEGLGPMAAYIFHRMMLLSREDGGYVIFVDEIPRYLKNKYFAPYIEILLEEIRKTQGVFIGAAQTAREFLQHEFSSKFQNNITTLLLFPEPRADRKDYIDGLGLNETEFRWIQTAHHRQVLLKRHEGESVILNIDLAPLGPHLKAVSGGAAAIKKMNGIRAKHPNTWIERYLAS